MARSTTRSQESNTNAYAAPEDVAVGDVIAVDGPSFLPKSDLEVVSVDPEWADDYDDARVFAAKIPNHANAREYTFKVNEFGSVVTTGSNGTFGVRVTVDVVEAADEPEAENAARQYARDPSQDTFDAVVDAVETEYDEDDHDPITGTVLSTTGLAASLVADAVGYDATTMIDFDRNDEVTVDYDSFDEDDPHATPIDLVKIAAFADAATDRTVRFRDGAGSVRIFVEVDRAE